MHPKFQCYCQNNCPTKILSGIEVALPPKLPALFQLFTLLALLALLTMLSLLSLLTLLSLFTQLRLLTILRLLPLLTLLPPLILLSLLQHCLHMGIRVYNALS